MNNGTSAINNVIAGATLLLATSTVQAQLAPVSVEFEQSGFARGKISGYLSGIDADGDGQLYAVSRTISQLFGMPFGNEVEYARITFQGFGLKTPVTLTYDKAVADMEAFENTFMAFAYNINGGPLGDEANEGMSFAVFAPSINYVLGELFNPLWYPDILPDVSLTSCGPRIIRGAVCASVLDLVPDASATTGVAVEKAYYSRAPVKTRSADPADKTYEIEVAASFGEVFTDCLSFDGFNRVSLAGLGQQLTYLRAQRGGTPNEWLAVTPAGAPLSLALNGKDLGKKHIRGNGINAQGDGFVFSGSLTESACSADGATWMR